jgi:hypothetical protein
MQSHVTIRNWMVFSPDMQPIREEVRSSRRRTERTLPSFPHLRFEQFLAALHPWTVMLLRNSDGRVSEEHRNRLQRDKLRQPADCCSIAEHMEVSLDVRQLEQPAETALPIGDCRFGIAVPPTRRSTVVDVRCGRERIERGRRLAVARRACRSSACRGTTCHSSRGNVAGSRRPES